MNYQIVEKEELIMLNLHNNLTLIQIKISIKFWLLESTLENVVSTEYTFVKGFNLTQCQNSQMHHNN